MKKATNFLRLFCLVLLFLPIKNSYCGDCFYWPKTLEAVLKQNKGKNNVYFRAKIIEPVKLQKPNPYLQAFNIKIHEYWGDTPFETESDTLCILGNVCGMTLKPGSEYLLVLEYDNGYYCDREWSGTDSFQKYKKEISLLGPSRTIQLKNSPVTDPQDSVNKKALLPTAVKTRSNLILWLTSGLVVLSIAVIYRIRRKRI